MGYQLGKSEKLCGETTVNRLFTEGFSQMAHPMRIVWRYTKDSPEPGLKFLVSVPKKKLKHAVDRNRIKRLIREAYRLNKQTFENFARQHNLVVELAFIWIPSELDEYGRVERKLREALEKIEKKIQIQLS
jgi:ribonuclease P protein component